MFRRNGRIIFRGEGICPDLKAPVRKSSLQKLFNYSDAKPLLSQHYFFKPNTNERTIARIVNNTCEEIDEFSKLIIIFEIFKQEK